MDLQTDLCRWLNFAQSKSERNVYHLFHLAAFVGLFNSYRFTTFHYLIR